MPAHEAPTAERSVLGSILVDPSLIWTARATLEAADFVAPSHRITFEAMCTAADERVSLELHVLSAWMRKSGDLEKVGGAEWLGALADECVTATGLESAAQIVADAALLRRIERFGQQAAALSRSEGVPAREIAARVGAKALELCSTRARKGLEKLGAIVKDSFRELERIVDAGGRCTGVATGFGGVDSVTRGWQKTDLVVIAGRPGMGKSAFAMASAITAARSGVPVLVFSMEMGSRQIGARLITAESHVPMWRFRRGLVSEDDWTQAIYATDAMCKLPLWIDESPALTTIELAAKARALKHQHGIGLIVVDYLQLERSASRGKDVNREREVSEISQGLKALAKELDVPVLALSQLNRSVEGRLDKKPNLSDLRDSGSIEQDADIVLFLYRDEYYHPDSTRRGVADVIVAKNRNGPSGITVEVGFNADEVRFYDREEAA